MKLKANIPLDDKRAQAISEIDLRTERALASHNTMAMIYSQKRELAKKILEDGEAPPDWLLLEAQSKGLEVNILCLQILERSVAEGVLPLLLEGVRQRAKAAVRAATSEQEIAAATGKITSQG